MKDIVIVGAGDFGKEVVWLIEDINKKQMTYNILGFLDDDSQKTEHFFYGIKCIGGVDRLNEFSKKDICAVIAMQDGNIRKKIVDTYPDFKNWETLIHPSVNIARTSVVGGGCILCAGTNISVDTKIGSQCLFNLSVIVGHDCVIEDYVSAMSGTCVCGHVHIKEGAYLATNCSIVPKMKIGSHAKVGAGSVVIRNVRDNVTVMGVPAVTLKF